MKKRRGSYAFAVVLILLGRGGAAWAQTKMTIATGVDPVFSAYYVAQQEGLFKKHGLDVRINTGPSGSAMVSFLINGQIESAFGSEIAGVANHNLDPNVVVVAQATRLVRWIAIVGRNIDTLDQLKGKKLGVARGSGGEVFWLALVDKLKLNAADYTVVNVEAPERWRRSSAATSMPTRCGSRGSCAACARSRTPRSCGTRKASSSRASTST